MFYASLICFELLVLFCCTWWFNHVISGKRAHACCYTGFHLECACCTLCKYAYCIVNLAFLCVFPAMCRYWLSVGAQPSDPVQQILFRAGLLPPPPMVVMGRKGGPRDTRSVDPLTGRVTTPSQPDKPEKPLVENADDGETAEWEYLIICCCWEHCPPFLELDRWYF